MRTERDKGLAAEVVFVEERVERHRHIVPPVGESDEDHIVVIEIFDVCSQLRTGIVVYLDLCRIDQCLMRAGIGVYGLYLEKVATRSFPDDGCDVLRIPHYFTIGNKAAGSGRSIHSIRFGNGEINYQRFSFSTLRGRFYLLSG